MSITPLPTPPSRDQAEATFVNNANAFLGALPTFATEANQLAVDVEAAKTTAEAARDAAVGAANYQGEYNAGTTYQVGESVSYLGDIFTAKTVNTGVTPAAGANWFKLAQEFATDYQEFLASGAWTKPAGVTWVFVEAIGGGGSGSRSNTGGQVSGGGGGGFNSKLFRASEFSATETVTIGAGGLGRASNTGANAGFVGGNTTFGSFLTAPGGGAGTLSRGGDGGGGEIGADGGGDPRAQGGYSSGAGGNDGSSGANCIKGGAGGGSQTGAGGTSQDGGNGGAGANSGAANATAGAQPGGGGGGKFYATNATDGGSGAGGAGRVRVWAW